MVALGAGAAVLGLAGPGVLHGRGLRIGLVILAVGLVSLVVSGMIPIPEGSNNAESLPYILSLGVGLLATVAGAVLTGLSLARTPGLSRLVGVLILVALFPGREFVWTIVAAVALWVLATRIDRAVPEPRLTHSATEHAELME